jgi:hypothetical protein
LSPFGTSAVSAQPAGSYQNQQSYPDQGSYQGQGSYQDQGGYQNQAPPPGYNGAPQQGYNGAPPQGYNGAPPQGYNGAPPQGYADVAPPPGYDGTQLPPPPPGYQPSAPDLAQRDRDDRYAADAEAWARANCFKSQSNAGAGAVIGGIFGALVGNGLSGRHDRGAGTLAGAAIGAVGGAAIGDTTRGQTSPGCPPGYVVRREAPPLAYDAGYYADYSYAAPGWYRPWVFVDGYWNYRPYPYHAWYYRTYRPYWGRPGFYGRPAYYGRPGGWRGGYRRHW